MQISDTDECYFNQVQRQVHRREDNSAEVYHGEAAVSQL